MTESLILQAAVRLACPLLLVLLAASVKASVFIAFAFIAAKVIKGIGAKLKHALWLSTIGGCFLALILSINGPLFQLAAPPLPAAHREAFVAISSALLPATSTSAEGMSPLAAEIWRRASLGRPGIDAWPAALLFLWLVGALSGWLRILWGRFQLLSLTQRGQRDHAGQYARLVLSLSRRVGISREVRVLESARCPTPLTHGIVRRVIVLPAGMRAWSTAAKRSVLLHELRHVQRGDSFSLAVAYGICSLLWFVPPVWAAYARLYLEQEKACDAAVVQSGVKRHAYATCILDAAQFSREPVLFAGLSFSRRRRRILQDRIRSILRAGHSVKKGVILFALTALLLGALVVGSAAGLDTAGQTSRKYGKLYLAEYPAKDADEAAILNTLIQYETAFNSHDLQKLLSLFAEGATYHPCGVDSRYAIGSQQCQNILRLNFRIFKFEKYYDPKISVNGETAAVTLLLETGDYLADYTFALKKENQIWLVTKADYANDHEKG